ncbi:MAG: hypothetical protein ABIH40_00645 [Candidatus Omnitrophota bacterium]
MRDIKGLATGIGSLPHKDIEAALDLIFKYTPKIPFWPQLPKRDIREGMVAQFCEGLPCIKVDNKGVLFSPEKRDEEFLKFYEHLEAEDLDYFRISEDFALGLHKFYQRLDRFDLKDVEYIKCQVTGPFTMAASIKDENGIALLHDYEFIQAISKVVAMKMAWQIRFFKKFKKKIIIFIDEPYLGSFGSAHTPINREEVVRYLAESGEDFKEVVERHIQDLMEDSGSTDEGSVLIGVHCCGNTDWSMFTDISTINIISFDAFNFLDRILLYTQNLISFFKRGGMLAWGIVPTDAFSPEINAPILESKIRDGVNSLINKGIEREVLKRRLLLTPSCGLGTLDNDKAEPIFKCLAELSSILSTESI